MGINVIRDGYCYGCPFFEMELREFIEHDEDSSWTSQDLLCKHEEACMRIKYLMENNPSLKKYEEFNRGIIQDYYKYCMDRYNEEVKRYGEQSAHKD